MPPNLIDKEWFKAWMLICLLVELKTFSFSVLLGEVASFPKCLDQTGTSSKIICKFETFHGDRVWRKIKIGITSLRCWHKIIHEYASYLSWWEYVGIQLSELHQLVSVSLLAISLPPIFQTLLRELFHCMYWSFKEFSFSYLNKKLKY